MRKNPRPAKPPPHTTWCDPRAPVLKTFHGKNSFPHHKQQRFAAARPSSAVCEPSEALSGGCKTSSLVTLLTRLRLQ